MTKTGILSPMSSVRPVTYVAGCSGFQRRANPDLGREKGHALVGVEDVALDIVDDDRLAAERVHGAAEADPVEEFLLAGVLDFLGRQLAPAAHLARAQLVEARAVARIVGIEVMIFRRQKRVRPAR